MSATVNETPCSGCGEPLGVSVDRGTLKSCPSCSVEAGKHVFYERGDFGLRVGDKYSQSWCPACRERGEPLAPRETC